MKTVFNYLLLPEVDIVTVVNTLRKKEIWQILSQLTKVNPKPNSIKRFIVTIDPKNVERKIDLHGYNSREIKPLLEEFIDEAHQSRLPTILIIHGKGEGILKSETINILNNDPRILRHEPGIGEKGGFGGTIAELKYIDQINSNKRKNNTTKK